MKKILEYKYYIFFSILIGAFEGSLFNNTSAIAGATVYSLLILIPSLIIYFAYYYVDNKSDYRALKYSKAIYMFIYCILLILTISNFITMFELVSPGSFYYIILPVVCIILCRYIYKKII
jgi:hypothetical protein